MTTPNGLDRRLTDWLADQAPTTAPDALLDELRVRAARTRRRPPWATSERWISMETRAQLGAIPRLVIALLVLLSLLALATAFAFAAGTSPAPRLPPPYGPAANGLVAFDAAGDIWVVEPDGSGLRQLTTGPALEHGPAWSRDGTRIAYWSQETQGGPSSLVVADADGSGPIVIATDEAGRTSVQFLDWSADGTLLAYSLGYGSIDERAYVAATDGSGARQVGDPGMTSRMPSWSPDGTSLAFSGNAPGAIEGAFYPEQGVYLMDPDGSNVRRLSTRNSSAQWEFYWAEWSADGTRLATNVGGGVMDIAADGSGETDITPAYGDAMVARWSPDGGALLFTRNDSAHLYTVPASGGESFDLGPATWGHAWSPDGTMIATGLEGRLTLLDAQTGEVVVEVPVGDQSYPDVYHYPSWQRLAP